MENSKDINKESKYPQKSRNKKRIVLFGIMGMIVVAIVIIAMRMNWQNQMNKITDWKESAITSPKAGALKAAGYTTINWKSAGALGAVRGYKVYIDDELVAETDAKTRTYEYHGVKVKGYEVYIEADLENDSKIYSNVLTFYINKKGLCVNKDMAQNIEAPDWGVSWYYNWSMEAFKYTSFQDLEYVPMMWTTFPTDQKTISRFHGFGYKYILAFNEPDLAEQSNIDVDTAVEGMKAFMDQNLIVGSPATALCPPWSKKWFQPFMKKMKEQNMDVDFIPIHHYWNWFDKEGVEAFLDLVKESYEMYHKPIWITEFAISGDPGKNAEQRQKVIDYMNMVIPELDKMDYVERYAWFSFNPDDPRNGASSLMQYYEGDITDLGYLYQKLGMPEGYGDKNIECNVKNPQKDVIR